MSGLRIAVRRQRRLRRVPRRSTALRRHRGGVRLRVSDEPDAPAYQIRRPARARRMGGRRARRRCARRACTPATATTAERRIASWRYRSPRHDSASAVSTRRAKLPCPWPEAPACRSPPRSRASSPAPPQVTLPWAQRAAQCPRRVRGDVERARCAHRIGRRHHDDRRHPRRGLAHARQCRAPSASNAGSSRGRCRHERRRAVPSANGPLPGGTSRSANGCTLHVPPRRRIRRRPRAPRNSAQHRQRDQAHRQHGHRPASRRTARLSDGRSRIETRRDSTITNTRAFACIAISPSAAPRSKAKGRGAGSRSPRTARHRSTRRTSRRRTSSCSAANRRACPAAGPRLLRARGDAPDPDAARRAQPQSVERSGRRRLRGLATGRVRRRRLNLFTLWALVASARGSRCSSAAPHPAERGPS